MKANNCIKKETFYSVTCFSCKVKFSAGDNLYDLFQTKKEAIEVLKENNWVKKGDKILCEKCW